MIISKRFRLLTCIACSFMMSCGTLGSIGDGIYFTTSKINLENAMGSLYIKYPEYKMPEKWNKYNGWSKAGYDFLESRIFYFKSNPEEMYYVTFIGDSAALVDTSKIGIGIRAVFSEKNLTGKWWLLGDDLNKKEKNRIERRFDDEIISKLEQLSKSKVRKENFLSI